MKVVVFAVRSAIRSHQRLTMRVTAIAGSASIPPVPRSWATFPAEAFRYTQGVPGVFKSSEWGQREFCRDCGTQLLFRNTADKKQLTSISSPWTARKTCW